ncbi:MAG: ubiquitin-like protein Pup [Propionicimonas sp.]|uniref:ubiquitin-like protein Pup n=1 Tax=Propionicimonas sp. TaxID=1955623 RepID=UPI002B1F2E51|nr:ubiquitin-like protein Pup [Propionicimonas sp.]MEA4945261.1 ubiquitin-like protein Pup [Propionicimonas sp.]MEA5054956.1 ubiquitin-like protein Pup [Propionicimonas sp.]MEA5117444.1 ubiquitin-like protein Pup [Propionicimonas sp.]
MAERVQRERPATRREDSAVALTTTNTVRPAAYDAILDEIDAVLETDAEEYVRSFVQKGGQ